MGKQLIYNDDGWSSYMRYPAPMSPEDILRVTVEPVADTAVSVYQFCALGGHAVNYGSHFLPRVGDRMERINTMHVWRMRKTLEHLASLGTDPLRIVSEGCHERGLLCQFSLRMNDTHHIFHLPDGNPYFPELSSPWFEQHPEALLPSGQLDYAHPDVHAYRLAQVTEILEDYDVDGIDLDFTRFRPWFREGAQDAGRPLMTELVTRIADLTASRGKTLSARLEYDPRASLDSGLDVEKWLTEGLLDQITLGGVGDHTPDAPAEWFLERAHKTGCKVYPGIEGQLHWLSGPGSGGTGLRPGNGVVDGYGPPSLAYMRAVAAVHYMDGADGVSLFNFTCADGPFALQALTELGSPEALALADKQYVVAVWPWDAGIFQQPWESRCRLEPGQDRTSLTLRLADPPSPLSREPKVWLTLDWMGLNRSDDVAVSINGIDLDPSGGGYNHWDHGCWNDMLGYEVPAAALWQGDNELLIARQVANEGFEGPIQLRRCVLEVTYSRGYAPGVGLV